MNTYIWKKIHSSFTGPYVEIGSEELTEIKAVIMAELDPHQYCKTYAL